VFIAIDSFVIVGHPPQTVIFNKGIESTRGLGCPFQLILVTLGDNIKECIELVNLSCYIFIFNFHTVLYESIIQTVTGSRCLFAAPAQKMNTAGYNLRRYPPDTFPVIIGTNL